MPRGASPKREREYEELKQDFRKEGRYKGREKEVASRIVNKQRARFGETQEEKERDRKGLSSDRNLPIPNYDHLTVPQVQQKINALSSQDIKIIMDYESTHRKRKTLIEKLDHRLSKD